MALLLGDDAPFDEVIAAIQNWAGKIDGINAESRLNELSSGISRLSTVQPGSIQMYGGSSAPTGYLLCDGSAVSRSTYAALFAVLGTTYGAGNGSTTFNVPNLRQRFPLGKAASGTGATLGSTGGSIDHTHTIAASGTHTHGAGSYATPTHDHGGSVPFANADSEHQDGTGALFDVPDWDHTHTIPTQAAMTITGASGADGNHTHGGATGSTNPPYTVVNFIVKT